MSKGLKHITFSIALLFIALFIFTLVNAPISWNLISLLPLSGFLMFNKIRLKKKALIETVIFFLILIISILRFQTILITKVDSVFYDAFYGNVARYVMCIVAWLLVRSIALETKRDFIKPLLPILLKIHLTFFFVQIITYLGSGYYLDVYKVITGNVSRYESYGVLNHLFPLRATGMFSEPSTYFFVTLCLLLLIWLKNGFRNNRKLTIVSFISFFLTFSTAAFVVSIPAIIYYLYKNKIRTKYFLIISLFLLPILFTAVKIDRIYEAQSQKISGSDGNIRKALLFAALNRDLDDPLTVDGAFAMDYDTYSMTLGGQKGGREAGSLNDSGVFVFLWVYFGYFGIICFIILATIQFKKSRANFWLFLILSLTKIKVFGPLFIFYYAYSLTYGDKNSASRNIDNFLSNKSIRRLSNKV